MVFRRPIHVWADPDWNGRAVDDQTGWGNLGWEEQDICESDRERQLTGLDDGVMATLLLYSMHFESHERSTSAAKSSSPAFDSYSGKM